MRMLLWPPAQLFPQHCTSLPLDCQMQLKLLDDCTDGPINLQCNLGSSEQCTEQCIESLWPLCQANVRVIQESLM